MDGALQRLPRPEPPRLPIRPGSPTSRRTRSSCSRPRLRHTGGAFSRRSAWGRSKGTCRRWSRLVDASPRCGQATAPSAVTPSSWRPGTTSAAVSTAAVSRQSRCSTSGSSTMARPWPWRGRDFSTSSTSTPPRSCAADCERTTSCTRWTPRDMRLTAISMPRARCWAATTTPGPGALACPYSRAGSQAVLRLKPENYEREPVGSLSSRALRARCSLSRCSDCQKVSPRHAWRQEEPSRGRVEPGRHRSAGVGVRADLEAIVGAAALDERPVRDLWPLAIMEERAGQALQRVLVARPSGREQVAAILRWAATHRVTVTPLGGASGVCGAVGPQAGELVIDMGAFDRILEVDEINLVCRCESGVNGMALEEHLNQRGLTLGHFPSSLPGTTVGGLCATRSSGQESSRYGSIEDMVMGLAVVLPDGTFAAPRPGPRSAVGPALHQLWLGSEGTLGVILGAVLRVHRLPEAVIGRGFAFAGLTAGLEAMRSIMQSGLRPLVMRLYDAADTAFNGYDLPTGGCLLVIATAGLPAVARAEADAVITFAG